MNIFSKIVRFITLVVTNLLFRVELKGRENIPSDGPFLLCANHISLLDMFFIACRIKRWIFWMAKEELFRNPILGYILSLLGAYPVKRGKADKNVFDRTFELLNEGHAVGIFPQGTRTKEQNLNVIRAKAGAGLIASKSAVPILPVAIRGPIVPFKKVVVIYGEPFFLETKNDNNDGKVDYRGLSKYIMQKVFDLLEEK